MVRPLGWRSFLAPTQGWMIDSRWDSQTGCEKNTKKGPTRVGIDEVAGVESVAPSEPVSMLRGRQPANLQQS
jgi:hypothetical protein